MLPAELEVMRRHRAFQCSRCGKLDEAEVVRSQGIDDVAMNARCDLHFSSDEWLLLTPAAFDSLEANRVLGLTELARNEQVVVVMPELAPVVGYSFEELDAVPALRTPPANAWEYPRCRKFERRRTIGRCSATTPQTKVDSGACTASTPPGW